MSPIDHHYVPQFLLAGWCRADGRLAVYSMKGGRLVVDWHAPKHTGYERNLYSLPTFPEAEKRGFDPQCVERFLMRDIDDAAAKVRLRLQSGDVARLNEDDRVAWTRFLRALFYRSPTMVSALQQSFRQTFVEELERDQADYEAMKEDWPLPDTWVEWHDTFMPGTEVVEIMLRGLPKLIDDAEEGDIIINMRWEVLDLTDSKFDLLTSDRPLILVDEPASRNCLIALPLNPTRLFVASHYDRRFDCYPPDLIARRHNTSTVMEAHQRVYGTGAQHKPLVEKYLGRPVPNSA